MSKKCCKCHEIKSFDDFHKSKSREDGLQRECKQCRSDNSKQWYKDNTDIQRQRSSLNRERTKTLFKEYKQSLKCENCGDDRWYVLEFHHKDPSKKDRNISIMVNGSFAWSNIIKEIDKCKVLCANCHREYHYINNITKSGE